MTVSTTINRQTYTGNGTSTVFSFPYKIFSAKDLAVYVATVLKTINVDYTVALAADYSSATITFTSAPANAAPIVLVYSPNLLQQTQLPSTGAFPSVAVEQALDKLTLITQRQSDLLARSFVLADSDTSGASTILPTPTANQLIGWNSGANGLINYAGAPSVTVSTAMSPVVQASTLAAGRTAFGLGTAATQNTGTSGANLPFLNGANTWSGQQDFTATTALVATQTAGDSSTKAASTAFVAGAFKTIAVQKFTASGTYTPTARMVFCIVEAWGGGAGGGGAITVGGASNAGGGGGAGGDSRHLCLASDIGASKAVVIGSAGSGGAAGNNPGSAGGNTTLGTTLVVANGGNGGAGGISSVSANGGGGGTVGTGNIAAIAGQNGGNGFAIGNIQAYPISGAGGSTLVGGGGTSVGSFQSVGGNAGAGFGSGGSGGISTNGGASQAGGNGTAGYMIITEFASV